MSTIKSIAKNTFLLVAANFISLGIGFFINIYIARYLIDSDYGMINAAINLSTLAALLTDLGLSSYLTLQLARRPGEVRQYLNNALSIKLGLVTVAYMCILATAFIGHFTGTKMLVVMIIGIYVMITAISQIFQSTFQAFQRMEHIAICQILNPVVLILGTFYVISNHLGVVSFALVYLVSGAVILTYNIIVIAIFYSKPVPGMDVRLWKQLILGGIPFSIGAIFSFLYYKIDIQLLDFMMGDTAVGNYSAAYRLIEALLCLPIMYGTVLFPIVSSYFHNKDPNIHVLLEKSIKYLYIAGLPIVIGTVILSSQFIGMLYQGKFVEAIPVLQILAVGLLITFLNNVPSTYLIGTNMQKASVIINMVCAAVNITLNLALIPSYGIVGSACTMVVTQLMAGMITYFLLKRMGYSYPGLWPMLKVTFCGLAMGALVFVMQPVNIVLIIGAAAVAYSALILVTGSVTKDDFSLLSSIFKKKAQE